jgi:hypothetical protein
VRIGHGLFEEAFIPFGRAPPSTQCGRLRHSRRSGRSAGVTGRKV